MNELLRIIHLEDDPKDADLVKTTLAAEGIDCDIRIAATYDDFAAALDEGVDLILADLALPAFDVMTALAIVREKDPEIPFIFVTGRQGEEAAIESLKSGATDYVLKNRLSRLGPAINRALSEAYERTERRMAEVDLRKAYSEKNEIAESYQNLFTSIRDVIVVTDNERTILHVNPPALKEIFGYEREEAEGKSVRFLYADEEEYLRTGRELFGLSESVKGKIVEVNLKRQNGEIFIGELSLMRRLDRRGLPSGNIGIFRDISERKRAEESLRESEMRRYQLQVELACAADIQAKLLPRSHPQLSGFDIAAHCLPALQVGGDFFDWVEVEPDVLGITLGDVMGKGMAAAMLMATVRAVIRTVALHRRPAEALQLAEHALRADLENSESFVTLFHGQLDEVQRTLTFVDCGHGYVFLLHNDGSVEELSPRGVPLGVPSQEAYQEGTVRFEKGDALVLYSDGLIDARPELALTNQLIARHLNGATSAGEMLDRLIGMTNHDGPQQDDITVLVVTCTG